MLCIITLANTTLMFRKNLIKGHIHLVIYASFIDLREHIKNTNWRIVLNLSSFLYVGRTSASFKFDAKLELNNELMKLWCIKWEKRSFLNLINFKGLSFSCVPFYCLIYLFDLKFLVYQRISPYSFWFLIYSVDSHILQKHLILGFLHWVGLGLCLYSLFNMHINLHFWLT